MILAITNQKGATGKLTLATIAMQRSCGMAKTTDALTILDRMIGDDADMRQMIAEETLKAQIARMIYEARTAAGLTQQALAARVGTKPSVIARLEEADVDSNALFLLHRIAAALGHALDIRLVPAPEHRQSA